MSILISVLSTIIPRNALEAYPSFLC